VLIEVGGKGSIGREDPWMEDLMRQNQCKRSWQEFWNTRSLMERRYSEERSDHGVQRAICISSIIQQMNQFERRVQAILVYRPLRYLVRMLV
jgi:hypothetical protein